MPARRRTRKNSASTNRKNTGRARTGRQMKTASTQEGGHSRRKGRTVKVRIRWFRREKLKIGRVALEVLRVVKEVESEEVGDPLDILMSTTERLSAGSGEGLFEVEVSDGVRQIMGGSLEECEGCVLLFPRPARLLRVGVVRVGALERESIGGVAMFTLAGERVRMRSVRDEVYVYEGRVEGPDDAYLLILDTSEGRRLVRVYRDPIVGRLVQHVLSPPGQDQESPSNGHGGGGGSSPS